MWFENPGMTFFSTAEHQFPAITKGQDIETVPFLAACTEILPFFGELRRVYNRSNLLEYNDNVQSFPDVLGPTAFKPVKSDINGNVTVSSS